MKIQTVLGLCLSGSLLLTGQVALAADGKSNNRSERAVQVHIDKETGKKMAAADDSNLGATEEAAAPIVDTSGMMPVKSEPAQYHADGSMSAKIGTEHLKFLVMTVDENGEKAILHQDSDKIDLEATVDKGEE
jgi:hypothetical protein